MLFLSAALLLWAAFVSDADAEGSLRISAAGVRAVHYTAQRGDVHVVSGPPSEIVARGLQVEASSEGGVVRFVRSADSDGSPIEIAVPEDMRVEIALEEGVCRFSRTYGDARVRVQNGSVRLEGARGAFQASVEVGSIDANIFLNGASSFKVGRGDLRVFVLDNLSKPLSLIADEGDIRAAFSPYYGAALTARAPDGVVQSQLPLEARSTGSRFEKGSALEGSLGGGGPPLSMEAESGNIYIASLEEFAPAHQSDTTALIAYAALPPRIDGVLEAQWLEAPVHRSIDFEEADGFEIRLMRDDQQLYISFLSNESDWESLRARAREKDDPLIDEDDIFQLAAELDASSFRIAFNLTGALLDARVLPDGSDDLSWESGAQIKIALYPNAWTAEAAIPLESLGWDTDNGEAVRLFASRGRPAQQRWIEWAVEGGIARLLPRLDDAVSPRVPLSFAGLGGIPEAVVLEAAGLPLQGGVRVEDLAAVEKRLRMLGWFQKAEVALEEPLTEGGVPQAAARLTEPSAFELKAVDIVGASSIPKQELIERIGWAAGWTSEAQLERRRLLTENIYRGLGYRYASALVRHDSENAIMRVDEGFVAKLVVTGIETIPEEEVSKLLMRQVGRAYQTERVAEALEAASKTLSERYRSFERLEDGGTERQGPLRVWTAHVVERPPLQFAFAPAVHVSHIHGFALGGSVFTHRGRQTNAQIFLDLSYAARTRALRADPSPIHYRLGAAGFFPSVDGLRVGAEWSKRTRAHAWQESGSPPSLAADYFHTEEGLLFFQKRFGKRFASEARIGSAHDSALAQAYWTDADAWIMAPPNRPMTDGRRLYARASFSLDLRSEAPLYLRRGMYLAPRPSLLARRGVWVSLSLERGRFDALEGVSLKRRGDWTYGRVWADARAYLPLGSVLHLSARAVGQWTGGALPAQLQASIGPDSLLRSRSRNDLTGDNGFAASAELRAQFGDFMAGAFVDSGSVWSAGGGDYRRSERAAGMSFGWRMKKPGLVGAGLLSGDLIPETIRLEAAYPLTSADEDGGRGMRLWARLGLPY